MLWLIDIWERNPCSIFSNTVLNIDHYRNLQNKQYFSCFSKNRKLRYFEHLSSPITKNVVGFIPFLKASVWLKDMMNFWRSKFVWGLLSFLSNTDLNFYTPVFRRDVLWYGDVRPSGSPSVHPSVRLSVRPVSVRPFSALFSYMLWHIELKFCTWLCFDVLQIKFDCRHFASIFEGVMPLCELRIKVMCSFPHFSPTCFDILSSNFAYDFVSPYYKSISSALNLR